MQSLKYSNDTLMQRYMEKRQLGELNENRKIGKDCDVWIVTDGMKIAAHRAVLSKTSPYFRNMFNTDMMEANMDEVCISGFDHETMEKIIDDMYGVRAWITTDNAQSVILAANYMQLTDLVDRCAQFIIEQIDKTNCLSMKLLLESTNCDKKLISKTDDYINTYFVPLSKHESFVELDIEDVTQLLSSDNLYVESEIDVCEAGMRWLEEKMEREEYCERIFKCIRLTLIPYSYLSTKLSTYPLFQNNPNCRSMIKEMIAYKGGERHGFFAKVQRALSFVFPSRNSKVDEVDMSLGTRQESRRKCYDIPSALVKITIHRPNQTFDPRPEQSFDIYDTTINQWEVCRKTKYKLPYFEYDSRSVCHKRNIYLFDRCFFGKLDYDTGVYTHLPVYPWVSVTTSKVFIGNKLYTSDSRYNDGSLSIFDTETKQWSETPASNDRLRQGSSIGAIGKYIYVCGGTYGSRLSLNVSRYDTETMEWDYVAPMKQVKDNSSAICYRGKLYVIGKKRDRKSTFEVYNPVTNEWTDLTSANLGIVMDEFLVATSDGIYLIGQLGVMYHYNVKTDEWTEKPTHKESTTYINQLFFALPIKPHDL